MFMRWPARLQPGRDARLVTNVDIAPTILDAARIEPDGTRMDGRSLLEPGGRSRILLEHWHAGSVPPWASILTRRWQYIENYYGESKIRVREFYRLDLDPWQLTNLIRDGDPRTGPSGRRQRELSRELAAYRTCVGAGCP